MKTREQQLKDYLIERNVGLDSLEANSIREGADWQKAIDIDKACEWIKQRNCFACEEWLNKECADFRKVMEAATDCNELPLNCSHLTWQDVMDIVDIFGHTSRLDDNGNVRSQEDFFTEVLNKYNSEKNGTTKR